MPTVALRKSPMPMPTRVSGRVRSTRSGSTSTSRGFTLIEVLITTAVLAILASLAVPAFNGLIQNNRIRSAAYELMSSLTYSRSEAIKRNNTAGVAPEAGGWSDGWTVTAAGLGAPLKSVAVSPDIAINGLADGVAFPGTVTYQRTGRATGFTELRFTLRLADLTDDRFIRCVRVDFSGRAMLERDLDEDGDCSNG